MARPMIVLSEEQVAQVEGLASVLNQEQMADYFGVARSTFQSILDRDERVSGLYKKGRAKAIRDVGQGLLQQALGGNIGAAIFYLKTQAGWKETERHEHTGADGTAIKTEDTGQGAAKVLALLEQLAERSGTTGSPAGE